MGSSKKVTVGYWYKILYHAGLSKGPIDAFLEFRGGDKTAWKGELTASGTININQPKLWGGEKDQGGIVSDVDVMFGESSQAANAYLLANLGAQVPAWRGLATLVFKGGKYGAMNPYPQKASYKIRKIKQGWDSACWYPEKAEIAVDGGAVLAGSATVWDYIVLPDETDPGYNNLSPPGSGWSSGQPIFGNYAPASGQNTLWPVDTTLWLRKTLDFGIGRLTTFRLYGDNGALVMIGGEVVGAVNRDNAEVSGFDGTISIGINGQAVVYVKAWDEVASGSDTILGVDITQIPLLAMNPAHVLYFARTNSDLGREPTANISSASLTAAADTLFSEGFGICTSRDPAQESVEEFEGRITKLIDGSFSRDPISGLWHLDLSRGDYVLEELPILADDDILEFRELPSTLDNAINSVSVTYFDPERKESITTPPVQARALIQDFGTIHQTIEYPEIPTADLAARVALRELRATATPTRAFDLVCTRTPFAWRPNTYFRLQVPKRGIADMVCIVGEKESGSLKSGAIRLKAAQDIYSMPATTFVEIEPGVDTSPSQIPLPITLQTAFEAPYIELVATLSRADMDVLPDDAGYLLAVAADPAASRDYTMMVDAGAGYVETANGDWCPTATVVEASSWLDTPFTLAGGTRLDEVVVGSAALWEDEIVRVDAINPTTGAITLGRACADSLPAQHAAGSRIWFYQDNDANDLTEYTAGESLAVKLLTNTSSQQLDIGSATAMAVGMLGRAVLPYPPANIKINGAYYPASIGTAELLTITWAHRDRILQADQLVDFVQPSIGAEPGVTYTLRLYGETDTLLRTETGLTDTSYTWVDEAADSGIVSLPVPLWESDGSSLAGWTVVGATVDATLGDPAPSIKATGGQYAYIAPVAGLVGKTILARVRVIPGSIQLCNLYFGCDAAGAGVKLGLDARAGSNSGIGTTTSWTAWGGVAATGIVVPAGQWLSVRIDIKSGPVADWYIDGDLKQANVAVAVNGDYIAAHGDWGGGATGGNYNNLQILDTSEIAAGLNERVRIELESVRDGLTSRQMHDVTVERVS